MTIAEKMLELLDEGWGAGTLRYLKEGKVEYRCAIGLRLDAAEETCAVQNEDSAFIALGDDPVIAAMARIIREQYPETLRAFETSGHPWHVIQDALAKDINVVLIFNDRCATESDVRAVIEKVIAEGL